MKLLDKLANFKRKQLEVESVEPIDYRRQEIATVQVRDIKQYLIDEYERSQSLFKNNEYLRSELQKSKETEIKYDATLVTLDEYKSRLDSYEKKFLSYEKEIENAREETKKVRDELNDYKIRFQRASITKDEIKIEIIQEVKDKIIKSVMEHKGNLSKTKVVEIVKNVS